MPRYGFNFQWLYSPRALPRGPDEPVLDAMAAWGFDFVRLPTDYRLYSVDGDPYRPDESVLRLIDDTLAACRTRGLHLSLNLHRAPGYIITGWETEPYNLWADKPAQDAFVALWERFARREFYAPWRALAADGVPVHVGEMGCYERTPDEVAMAWFTDLFAVFAEQGWGYALWEFDGPFGIAGHRRPAARFERVDGMLVDRGLLDLMRSSRV